MAINKTAIYRKHGINVQDTFSNIRPFYNRILYIANTKRSKIPPYESMLEPYLSFFLIIEDFINEDYFEWTQK